MRALLLLLATLEMRACSADDQRPAAAVPEMPQRGATSAAPAGSRIATDPGAGLDAAARFTASAPLRQRFAFELITDRNLRSPAMFGGWGPHLKPLVVERTGAWFVRDTGAVGNIQGLEALRRSDAGAWSRFSTANAAGYGGNQPMAVLARSEHFYAYNVDPAHGYIVQCYLSRTDGSRTGACNALIAGGGPIRVTGANYIGAALDPAEGTTAWWSNSNGWTSYTWQQRVSPAGWNGPWGIYNGSAASASGYINGNYRDDQYRLMLFGQIFTGTYPSGFYDAVYAELRTGNAATFSTPLRKTPFVNMTAEDGWVDPRTGRVHLLARVMHPTGSVLEYYSKLYGEPWTAETRRPLASWPAFRGRFYPHAEGMAVLIGGVDRTGRPGEAIPLAAYFFDLAQARGALPFASVSPARVPIDALGLRSVSAIYVGRPGYQLGLHPKAVMFAIVGDAPANDHKIYAVRIEDES